MLLPKESAHILSLVHAYIYTYILEKWAIGLKIYFTDLKTLAYPVGLVSLIVPFCKERDFRRDGSGVLVKNSTLVFKTKLLFKF